MKKDMTNYLEFKPAKCKNCNKCLRECSVKAIEVASHQATIMAGRCILCGRCINVCPQNAKIVHSETDKIKKLLKSGKKVIASVAPSFVSSFEIDDFNIMKLALGKLGFSDSEETAVGANKVIAEYKKLLLGGKYKNFITSCCPSVNSLISLFYPKALEYLAPVDSPMVAHAKMIKAQDKSARIVFISPCIAKKKEAVESGIIDGVLTFEELSEMFKEADIDLNAIARLSIESPNDVGIRSKFFPISRGIIKSFDTLPKGYEYVAVDGVKKCTDLLENIADFEGMFFELNSCDYGCINGPCSLNDGDCAIRANSQVRKYAGKLQDFEAGDRLADVNDVDIKTAFKKGSAKGRPVTDREIAEVLSRTGKVKPQDELNCGACGYDTCRQKAWAVINGFADVELCLPYMRERAESMSYEIIQNSPNGIIAVDFDLKVTDISKQARKMLGITDIDVKGRDLNDFMNVTDFVLASSGENINCQKVRLDKTGFIVELTISVLSDHKVMFGILKDITEQSSYDERLNKVRMDTITTTDDVIKKQMRVAQEIASLLGETTAETKVALLKLKKALSESGGES